jgi:hypothetical protein
MEAIARVKFFVQHPVIGSGFIFFLSLRTLLNKK